MKPGTAADGLRARLLTALAVNRTARLNFPGMFMRLAGERRGEHGLDLTYDDGAWARNGAGEVPYAVLGVLLDVALGGATRLATGSGHRPATVQLAARFTGEPVAGAPVAHAKFTGYTRDSAVKHALAEATLTAGGAAVAHASGCFVMLPLPDGETQRTLPWVPAFDMQPLQPRDLHEHERAVLRRFDRAQRAADAAHPFVEHFWAGIPRARERGASLAVTVTPHLGNRVGQVHGGLLFGLAAQVAAAAVPGRLRLSNIAAWFLAPGTGPRLHVRSEVVHHGRNVVVVRTRITGAGGARVLEATTQHLRVAG